ncbi:MAG: HdeD family acid-resistance protein [Bilifractor sp.]|jgi:uncharacterized membrane protein HdeD (DUF308 family)
MKPNRIIAVICGGILIVTGFVCMTAPFSAYRNLGILICIMMVICGLADINLWIYAGKIGLKDSYSLATGLLSFLFSIIILLMVCTGQVSENLLLLIDGLWILTAGIMRLLRAVDLHKNPEDPDKKLIGPNWGWLLFTGILEIVIGVCCLILPQYFIIEAGALLAMLLMIAGANILAAAIS